MFCRLFLPLLALLAFSAFGISNAADLRIIRPRSPRIPRNGNCTIGSRIPRSCAPGLVCVLYKKGIPEIGFPHQGNCKPLSEPKCQDRKTKLYWRKGTVLETSVCGGCRCPEDDDRNEFSCYRNPISFPIPRIFFPRPKPKPEDPCAGRTCWGYPTAKCRRSPCSVQLAEWWIGDSLVDCNRPIQLPSKTRIPLNGNCTIGSRTPSNCAPGLVCVLYKKGIPEIYIPHQGNCKPLSEPKCEDTATNLYWKKGTYLSRSRCEGCRCPEETSISLIECYMDFTKARQDPTPMPRDPCKGQTCRGYPLASCRPNNCDTRLAEWSIGGSVVYCKPPVKGIPVNGSCTVGSRAPKNCAAGLVCVLNEQGRPKIGIPHKGVCKPRSAPKCEDVSSRTFWAPGTTLKKARCDSCVCRKQGNYKFDCNHMVCAIAGDPCLGQKCLGHPTAKCQPTCDLCGIEWLVRGKPVKCR